jgi:hypothetical protein
MEMSNISILLFIVKGLILLFIGCIGVMYLANLLLFIPSTIIFIFTGRYLNYLYVFTWKIPEKEAELHSQYALGLTWTSSKIHKIKRIEAIETFKLKYPSAKLYASTATLQDWYEELGIHGEEIVRTKKEERSKRITAATTVFTNLRNLFIFKGGWKASRLVRRIWSTPAKKYKIL